MSFTWLVSADAAGDPEPIELPAGVPRLASRVDVRESGGASLAFNIIGINGATERFPYGIGESASLNPQIYQVVNGAKVLAYIETVSDSADFSCIAV